MRAEEERLLVTALVGERHRHLMLTNAVFAANVRGLAPMLMLWIDKLAEEGEKWTDDHQAEIKRLMNTPIGPITGGFTP